MLKWMELLILGATVAVIAGFIMAGSKFKAPPPSEKAPLGAADPPPSEHDGDGHPQTS